MSCHLTVAIATVRAVPFEILDRLSSVLVAFKHALPTTSNYQLCDFFFHVLVLCRRRKACKLQCASTSRVANHRDPTEHPPLASATAAQVRTEVSLTACSCCACIHSHTLSMQQVRRLHCSSCCSVLTAAVTAVAPCRTQRLGQEALRAPGGPRCRRVQRSSAGDGVGRQDCWPDCRAARLFCRHVCQHQCKARGLQRGPCARAGRCAARVGAFCGWL